MLSYLYQDSSELKNPKSLISTSQELLLHWINAGWKTSWHPEYLMAMSSGADENTGFFHCWTAVCVLAVIGAHVKLHPDHKSKLRLSRVLCFPWSPGNSCYFMTTFLFFKWQKSGSTEEMVKLAIYNECMKCQGKQFSINFQLHWVLKFALLHLSWSFKFH